MKRFIIMQMTPPEDLFTDSDCRRFASDVDHIVRIVDQANNVAVLEGAERLIQGLNAKYTKSWGLINHRSSTLAGDSDFVYLREKIFAKREALWVA